MNRLPYLDYLRGLAALLIMVYHFILFTIADPPTDSLIKRIGIYGVSVFYIISGLTLFHVYGKKLTLTFPEIGSYFIKRLLRILPLLWLATMASICIKGFSGFATLFLNLTGLFGLLAPANYIATGAWSIGNELAFYVFFPFFLFLFRGSKVLFSLLSALVFGIYVYFAFSLLPELGAMSSAWKRYILPHNQAFLFLAGILLGVLREREIVPQFMLVIGLLVSALVFWIYPVSGDAIILITGTNRLVFTLLSIGVVFCVVNLQSSLPKAIHSPLKLLGDISYSLYLLHPLVLMVTHGAFTFLNGFVAVPHYVVLIIAGFNSLVVSYVVYTYYELPFIRYGNKLIALRKVTLQNGSA